jgi:uncharacterized protein (TIGR02466 family)|tara:strand:- start:13589 stop:14170 length:582 start_codon:yes stop_codon:yes gene_type:complete
MLHNEMWFPSVIWSGIIPPAPDDDLIKFIYETKSKDPGVQVSNYGGWQSNSIAHGVNDSIDNLAKIFTKEANECALQTGMPTLSLYNLWINVNPPGAYNHLHNHAGAVLSGVYYVQAEPNQGGIQFERSDGAEYFLPEKNNKMTYFNCTRASYNAKSNALFIFPGWLKHSVEGNRSSNDRISISFNFGVSSDE